MTDLITRIHQIQDSETRLKALAAANFLSRIDDAPKNVSELVNFIASFKSAAGLDAYVFLTSYNEPMGLDPKILANEIMEKIAVTEASWNRELLFRCLNEGVFSSAKHRVVVADLVADRVATEAAKDLKRATAKELIGTVRTQQEHLTLYVAIVSLALCAIHSRNLVSRKTSYPSEDFPRPTSEILDRFSENWNQERFDSLMKSGHSLLRLFATRYWVMQAKQLRPSDDAKSGDAAF